MPTDLLSDDFVIIRNPLTVIRDLLKGFSIKATFVGAIFLLVASIGDGINGAILPVLFMQDLGWEPDFYSQIVGGLGTMLEFIGALLGGFLADRVGRRKIIAIGYGGFAITAILFGIFSDYWEFNYFASTYLIISPFFRALGAVAIFSLFMKISWTKSAATMFTSYMAMSNMSSTTGSKLAGALNKCVSNDTVFIVVGILAAIPLILLIGINTDEHAHKENH